jgi:hypothetical protein
MQKEKEYVDQRLQALSLQYDERSLLYNQKREEYFKQMEDIKNFMTLL